MRGWPLEFGSCPLHEAGSDVLSEAGRHRPGKCRVAGVRVMGSVMGNGITGYYRDLGLSHSH